MMNDLSQMWPVCHDCPYWEVCESPYICADTEQKYQKSEDD
jgi:hypothetical protein